MTVSRIKTCYIAAPAGANLDHLHSALHLRGVRLVAPDVDRPGSFSGQIIEAVTEAQLVIGVLTRERRSQSVLYELGIASALQRQIMLIAAPSVPVPMELQSVQVVRANLSNNEAIAFAIGQALAAPDKPAAPSSPHRNRKGSLGLRVQNYRPLLNLALETQNYRELENVVLKLLQETGETVANEVRTDSRFVDFAIWSDEIQPIMGNPILIELKAELRDAAKVKVISRILAEAVQRSGTNWGLLLYGTSNLTGEKIADSCPPNILSISLDRLLTEMERQPFSSVILKLRNARVHGVSL